jgi:hypothetical protein
VSCSTLKVTVYPGIYWVRKLLVKGVQEDFGQAPSFYVCTQGLGFNRLLFGALKTTSLTAWKKLVEKLGSGLPKALQKMYLAHFG